MHKYQNFQYNISNSIGTLKVIKIETLPISVPTIVNRKESLGCHCLPNSLPGIVVWLKRLFPNIVIVQFRRNVHFGRFVGRQQRRVAVKCFQRSKRFMPRNEWFSTFSRNSTLQTTHAIYCTMHAIDAIITPTHFRPSVRVGHEGRIRINTDPAEHQAIPLLLSFYSHNTRKHSILGNHIASYRPFSQL